ncbi:hypothetical protein HZH68_013838 [Vespula germanica]|uniref:Uncharacterized protein n=1 Tax=Vespula germanica TaxID=30212 RepID=A0A834JB92_VESGE|nr:hypothetical protein HZH68_013838 [Vespula germanica]
MAADYDGGVGDGGSRYTKKKVLGNLQINTVAKIVIDKKEFDRKSSYEWSMVKPRKDFWHKVSARAKKFISKFRKMFGVPSETSKVSFPNRRTYHYPARTGSTTPRGPMRSIEIERSRGLCNSGDF